MTSRRRPERPPQIQLAICLQYCRRLWFKSLGQRLPRSTKKSSTEFKHVEIILLTLQLMGESYAYSKSSSPRKLSLERIACWEYRVRKTYSLGLKKLLQERTRPQTRRMSEFHHRSANQDFYIHQFKAIQSKKTPTTIYCKDPKALLRKPAPP